ncbi:MAG: UDP-N-acetylmuramoyl-L-alanyl-D-glutamate--2,6-diaminopimelate ligase, partial [Syntrophomonadaceae bacterium]|nr:UDP-N-acetylmuramoyl-L-alanyl-D-glutamate--2,6-diaminopimelate ligase [Syntrophomonadaceae bacterium]
ITYGLGRGAEVRAVDVNVESSGSAFTAVWPGGSLPIALKLAGNFNVYNALAAIAFALGEGIEPAIIKQGLERVAGVPGRFESVACGQDFTVIVDYAHTPDGLKNILQTAQRMARGRIITVFGCGGDRDRGKRPLMGEIAARYSDFTIVTSDNPRTEEPMAIIEDILPGVNRVKDCSYAVVVDRREAIRQAVSMAAKDDIVIIAGKGHETYQLVKGEVFPFDDREVAREFLRGRWRNE